MSAFVTMESAGDVRVLRSVMHSVLTWPSDGSKHRSRVLHGSVRRFPDIRPPPAAHLLDRNFLPFHTAIFDVGRPTVYPVAARRRCRIGFLSFSVRVRAVLVSTCSGSRELSDAPTVLIVYPICVGKGRAYIGGIKFLSSGCLGTLLGRVLMGLPPSSPGRCCLCCIVPHIVFLPIRLAVRFWQFPPAQMRQHEGLSHLRLSQPRTALIGPLQRPIQLLRT